MAKSVSIMMGSPRDFPMMKPTTKILDALAIDYEVCVSSAHKTPERTRLYVEKLWDRGVGAVICGAGAAAHLAGVVAADYPGPVIAVPIGATELNGVDAMLAMVQMPSGVPVATVAIDQAGAENAGLLAAQCLSVYETETARKVKKYIDSRKKNPSGKSENSSSGNFRTALIGASEEDVKLLQRSGKILNELGISHEYFQVHPLTDPDHFQSLTKELEKSDCSVAICASGTSASLAAAVGSQFSGPVIGVPVPSTPLAGVDALLSCIQTPAGIPVATVAIGPMGAKNAGILAGQILAGGDSTLFSSLAAYRKQVETTLTKEADELMETLPAEHRAKI